MKRPTRPQYGKHRCILLAEDDDELRDSLSSLLQLFGYEVRALSNGKELLGASLAMLENGTPPAAVLSDHRMPDMTGLDAIQGLAAEGWIVPSVLITAFGDVEIADRATDLDVTLVRKPFSSDDLLTVVAYVMDRKQTERLSCAACGDRVDLRAEGYVYFCRRCRDIAANADLEDDMIDIGTPD